MRYRKKPGPEPQIRGPRRQLVVADSDIALLERLKRSRRESLGSVLHRFLAEHAELRDRVAWLEGWNEHWRDAYQRANGGHWRAPPLAFILQQGQSLSGVIDIGVQYELEHRYAPEPVSPLDELDEEANAQPQATLDAYPN